MPKPEKHVFLCVNSRPEGNPKGSCSARGAAELREAFAAALEARGLRGRFKLSTSSCLGACALGPTVVIYPDGVMYKHVAPNDVESIIEEHLLGDEVIDRLKAPPEIWD